MHFRFIISICLNLLEQHPLRIKFQLEQIGHNETMKIFYRKKHLFFIQILLVFPFLNISKMQLFSYNEIFFSNLIAHIFIISGWSSYFIQHSSKYPIFKI